jgi:hypothetical protein
LRTAAETKTILESQLESAMRGVEKPITDLQTATGVKDKVAQYWIDILLTKSRQMKEAEPSRSKEDIATELREWLKTQPGDKINPLLSIDGLLHFKFSDTFSG